MYAYKTDFSIAQTKRRSLSCKYFYTAAKKKNTIRHSNHGRRGQRDSKHPTCYCTQFLVYIDRYWYVSVRTNRRLEKIYQKTKTPQGADGSMAEAAPSRVRRDEQGEARRANTTPNGGPHLELYRAWPTYYSCIHTFMGHTIYL